MSDALQTIAVACAALGIVSATAVLARGHDIVGAVKVLLDFLLAAGLLRLADDPRWQQIAAAAAIVTVRRLLSAGLATTAPGGLPSRSHG